MRFFTAFSRMPLLKPGRYNECLNEKNFFCHFDQREKSKNLSIFHEVKDFSLRSK